MRQNRDTGGIVIASGIAAFEAEADRSFGDVFQWADADMYEHKRSLKREQGTH